MKWEEMTAAEFQQGLQKAQGTCILPFGIIEKHGPHLPLGNDLINVRYAVQHGVQQEYAIVFPEYYFGQIFEAKHEPGTVAYSAKLQLELLQETTDEMARNGCKKILIVNGHGGNEDLLPYFAQTQLDRPRDYVVYILPIVDPPATNNPPKKDPVDLHGGESETSKMLIARPDLVHIDRARSESGADQARLKLPDELYTAIWWYARFPDHYSGDGALATVERGKYEMDEFEKLIVKCIRAIKADQTSLQLQNEFFEKAKHPLDTRP